MNAIAQKSQITIALAGNPNAGKTTLFNSLTGLKQKVANYPGVTVERKEGPWNLGDETANLIDLPGLYSLDATSLDEQIASDIIRGKQEGIPKPDAIVAVVDATNLERNLYLVTQIMEHGIPVVIALTMIDVFEKQKHEIDIEMLSVLLKTPIVAVNVKKGRGIEELAARVKDVLFTTPDIHDIFVDTDGEEGATGRIFARYNFISNAVQESVWHSDQSQHRLSEKIDKVLTHKVFGLVILIAVLLVVFQTIFSWSSLPMDLLERGFGAVSDLVRAEMPPGILTDLIADGIIAGVGGVVVFLPQILLLFLFISLLEDSGYMARAAFLLDKLMSRVGLHGKAFLPLFSSFACAIPGIMATRTIESRRDRFATIMIAPFMSCSARLPVYTLMIAAFFAGQTVFGFISVGALLMLAMYALGIFVAIIAAFILKRTLLIAPPPPFLMEMPPYRVPNLRTVIQNMITRAWLFLKRAGTVILAISIILWALMYFPRSPQPVPVAVAGNEQGTTVGDQPLTKNEPLPEGEQLKHSFAGKLGHVIEPVISPLGFDWKIGVALIASFAAREVLVSTLSIIYNVGKDENEESETLIAAVRDAKREDGRLAWTPLTALTLMVFFVLAMQCMSTLAVVRRETNSWRWPAFMLAYMTGLAYAAAFATYQGGRLLGFE
ncbi:MAG TPA: ferrous iron transport protein B [Pyrinomonadaceae bacterium]|nr:ferrous iron transport protein B [Acidobacteriota bacterium]HQZ96629.1 ferrous iron transport protein B [Pyrinomonadaceae bacterium]